MTQPPAPRYSKGIARPVQAVVRPAQMADEKTEDAHWFEVEIRTTDSKGNTGVLHSEYLTVQPDAQKAAHEVSDAAVKKFGNNVYREIDDSQ